MQRTMSLAERLKNLNKKLALAIKTKKADLVKWYEHPTVDADEWDKVRNMVRKLAFWIIILICAETATNYFAVASVMTEKGWLWNIVRGMTALVATGIGTYIFEKFFEMVINEPKYKQIEKSKRKWTKIIFVTALCIGVEAAIYWLCRRRVVALEGNNGDITITYFVLIIGLLLPIATGYFAYERGRYISAYRNTLRIKKAEKNIAKWDSTVATNNQRMEDHFKRELNDKWALLDEFKIYKGNYNQKNGIKDEIVTGHFCETHDTFAKEAMLRYTKEILHEVPQQPMFVVTKAQENGHTKQIPQIIIDNQ